MRAKAAAFLIWLADSRAAVAPLLILALAERFGWTLAGHLADLETELRKAALFWARTGGIGDAFREGSGPTAHVGALPVLLPGLVYRLCGGPGAAATLVLTAISAIVVVATALVLNRVFARLGMAVVARGAAVLVICLLPLHLEIESRSLRVYENGQSALMIAVMLLAVLRLDQRGDVRVADMAGLSALVALMAALSPIAGAVAVVMLCVLALRRLRWPGRIGAAAILGLALVATTLPWAMHNRDVLGEMVWTRDNFGLEFALGTNAAAVDPADPGSVYLARLARIHPFDSPQGYKDMRAAGGELSYARALKDQTWTWVRAHPGDAARIWLRHAQEFFFPPLWMWLHSAPFEPTMLWRMLIVDLIAVLALAGLAGALARRDWLYQYVLLAIVLLPLPYLLTQPLVRYRYTIASLLVFLAADCVARLARGGLRQAE